MYQSLSVLFSFFLTTTAGFEPTHAKRTALAGLLLNHSDKLSQDIYFTTTTGFEPVRAKHISFQGTLLNHSDKLSFYEHLFSMKQVVIRFTR